MIPEILHMVWIGDRPFPHQAYLDAWHDLHPGWEINLWSDYDELVTAAIVDAIPHVAGKVNLIRLELLARYGGVYVDADTEPLRSLDDLPVPGWADSWAMTSRNGFVQNAIMAATKNHPVFTSLVAGADFGWRRLQGRKVVFTEVFGAHYITDALRAHRGFWEPDRDRSYRHRQVFRDREEGPPGAAWAIHDCERSWKQELGGKWVQL